MNSTELYQKLLPHLHVAVLHNDYGYAEREMKDKHPDRNMLSVHCTNNYLWGHYYARVAWGPARRSMSDETNLPGKPPTYEQFCEWYGLEMELV